ncbi:MAG: hypothetical protein K5871_06445 [Lachnospiraceae bacterium]|nr:hypothetical protein [Lachnospiraceae bacterium]
MGINRLDNGRELTQKQVTDLLYYYMVENQSGAYILSEICRMSKQEIGNTKTAWRFFDQIYTSYGFPKRYSGAYNNINYHKLAQYVSMYWNTRATEKDLLAFFPEIAADYAEAKRQAGERENMPSVSTGRRSPQTPNPDYDPYAFQDGRRRTVNYNPVHRQPAAQRTARPASQRRNMGHTATRVPRTRNTASETYSYSDSDFKLRSRSPIGGIIALIVVVVIFLILKNSGMFSSFGSVVKGILRILEILYIIVGVLFLVASIRTFEFGAIALALFCCVLIGAMVWAFAAGHIIIGIICIVASLFVMTLLGDLIL